MGLRDLLVQKWQHKDIRVRLAAVEQLEGKKAESVLRRLAIHDTSKTVRIAAISKLDRERIAALVRDTDSEFVRLDLVSLFPDTEPWQELLLLIALSDPSGYVRNAAAKKIFKDELLIQAALSDRDPNIGLVAAKKITDMSLVLSAAKESPAPAVRAEAVKRLDRTVYLEDLLSFAGQDPDPGVREAAVVRLHPEDCPLFFEKTAVSDDAPIRLRMAAIHKLCTKEQQDILRGLTAPQNDPRIRKAAVTRLDPDEALLLLLCMAESDPDPMVRRAAVEQINLEKIRAGLSAVAKNDSDAHVRAAAKKKTDAFIAESKKKEEPTPFRPADMGLEQWHLLLSHIAVEAPDPSVREAALLALDVFAHPGVPSKIAKADKNPNVRRAAVMKLDPNRSKKLLKTIAEKDKDARVRRAAAYRLSILK